MFLSIFPYSTETKIYWYPVRKIIHYNIYDCCPGWIGYEPKVGCKERKYLSFFRKKIIHMHLIGVINVILC